MVQNALFSFMIVLLSIIGFRISLWNSLPTIAIQQTALPSLGADSFMHAPLLYRLKVIILHSQNRSCHTGQVETLKYGM